MMTMLLSDILLVIGAMATGLFCLLLVWRLRKFNNLEQGVGGAILVLSAQVEELTRAMQDAQKLADQSEEALRDLTSRAEATARQLELMLAATQDAEMPEENPSRSFVRHDRQEAS